MDRNSFIQMLLPGAMEASKRTGIDPRIIIAQAANESAWGSAAPGNNYFGIKSHGQGGGQTFLTHEEVGGKLVPMRDSFRTYSSPTDSALGYADFINSNPRYGKFKSAQGLDAQLDELGKSGYASKSNYGSIIGNIARGINIDGMPQTLPGKIGGDSMVARNMDPQIAAATNIPANSPQSTNPASPLNTFPPAPSAPPQGLMAMLKGGADKIAGNPLLSALMQQPEAPQPMHLAPMAPNPSQAPSLTDYLRQFMASRQV